jgi:pimeloyl-ACP methyl ester carboxylesterase
MQEPPAKATDEIKRSQPSARLPDSSDYRWMITLLARSLLNSRSGYPRVLVWGDADRLAPIDVGRQARMLVMVARFAVLHEAAHVPHYEVPAAFAPVVRAFLADSEVKTEDAHFE